MRKRQLHQTFSSNPSVPSRASFPPLLSTSNRNASPKVIQPRFVKHKHNISTLLITLLLGLCVIPTLSFIPSSPISSGIKTIPIHTPSGGPSGDKASICSTRYSHISGQSKDTLAKCFSSPSSSDHQPSLSASSDSFHNNTLQSSFVSGEAKNKKGKTNEEEYPIGGVSRRSSLQGLILAAAATATASSAPLAASAGKPEVDTYGNLFSPKSDMLSGGSSAARGISTRPAGQRLKPGQALQSVYETRFIAYLSRFLLNFDPAANAWWRQSGFQDSWENYDEVDRSLAKFKFAEFAESVEFGLADYFVGPYGSYSSVQAAKAGILATDPAPSVQPKKNRGGFLDNIFSFPDGLAAKEERNNKKPIGSDPNTLEKYGVLNLYSLLKARYTSISAKRQLAMLFSFISSPNLQPTAEIRGLLAEADNATVSEVTVLRYTINNEERSRTSSRRGGGYSLDTFPEVTIESPPALGDDYRPAEVRPIMKPTSRILKIKVTDPGEGYKSSPLVVVQFTGNTRVCQATAIIDREGHISEVVVLDPGYGYGGFGGVPPKVTISKPKEKPEKGEVIRQAKAVAELEYEIVDIELISGGNGYTKTEPPKISITPPPEDPDWFLATQEQPEMRMIPVREIEPLRIEVNEMRNSDGNVVYSSLGKRQGPVVDKALVAILKRDPLELLPSNVVLEPDDLFDPPIYRIPALPPIPPNVNIPSPRFRAYDPIFGAVGAVPVTKGAVALKASEYGRLALSGAVCTVLVRTALNPLELVKTKQQLENDDELFDYARQKLMRQKKEESVAVPNTSEGNFGVPTDAPFPDQGNTAVAIKEEKAVSTSQAKSKKLGTTDLVLGILELRGPFALFQSADITFLASLVFGSFGFGATELFRRSFAQVFFSDSIDSSGGSEIALLLAASLATVGMYSSF